MADLDRQVETLLDVQAQAAPQQGLEAVQRKSRSHFTWLVLFQIKKKTYQEIINDCKLDRGKEAVRHGIQDAAKLVYGPRWKEEWLRRLTGGRPRKTR